jgi:VanZ family protein
MSHSNAVLNIIKDFLLRNIENGGLSHVIRKLAHFFIYFCLAFFLQFTFQDNCKSRENKIMVMIIIFCYACTDELHQHLVPGRGAKVSDVLIDTAGGMTSILIMNFYRIIRIKVPMYK